MALISNATVGNDVRSGTAFQTNKFTGFGIGSDTLTGGALADTFVMTVDGKTDVINGGANMFGLDLIDYSASDRGLAISLDAGTVTATFLTGFEQGPFGQSIPVFEIKTVATLTGIESAIGSRFDDTITGSNVINVLDGGDGNDHLYGLNGDDQLFGGKGNDTLDGGIDDDLLVGGAGNDTIIGGSGSDTVSYADSAVGMNIRLDAPLFSSPSSPTLMGAAKQITADGLVAEDTLSNIENVIGSDFDDVIKGNGALNTIDAGKGDDVIQSWVDGREDVANGGDGSDTIDYSGFVQANGLSIALGRDGHDGSASFITFTDVGLPINVPVVTTEDKLISIENVIGTNQGDGIFGNDEDNVLDGRGGNDTIYGLDGADTLIGGSGSDIFAFSDVSQMPMVGGHDEILDFERGVDLIRLFEIDANLNHFALDGDVIVDDAFTVVKSFTGTGISGELVGKSLGDGSQLWSGDVNGDRIADFELVVHTTDGLNTLLSAKDFVL